MFSRSVEDPDGNVWEIMWMNPAAAPEALRAHNGHWASGSWGAGPPAAPGSRDQPT
jgi:hypothetical protein